MMVVATEAPVCDPLGRRCAFPALDVRIEPRLVETRTFEGPNVVYAGYEAGGLR